jgi:anti-sigma regulatory factor (Ser/Thr protein kinase)
MSHRVRDLLKISFQARSDQLRHVRERTRAVLMEQGCDEHFRETSVLALDEAVTNVIRHAYAMQSGEIILEILSCGDSLLFRLTDFAPRQEWSRPAETASEKLRPGGLGIPLIQAIMDTVDYPEPPAGAGNVLEMSRRVN